MPRRDRFPGLDGLRALAVTAVVVFHFEPTVLPGGFLGVDLFFVISGYLITRLLLNEIATTGRLRIGRFYRRRMRRLLPAVVTLLVVTATMSALVWRDELPTTRAGVLASLTYVTNWWLIGSHQSYFVASGRPSMVQHLWSLGIEEQYYLIWPVLLLVITGAWVGRRRRGRGTDDGPGDGPAAAKDAVMRAVFTGRRLCWLAGTALVLSVASTVAMAVIAIDADIPYGADSGRVYFGTDTHSMGLLLGAAAGALATRSTLARQGMLAGQPMLARQGMLAGQRMLATQAALARWARLTRVWRLLVRGAFLTDLLAAVALVLLVRVMAGVDEFSPGLYRGGLFAASALGVVAVVAVSRPRSALGWLLDRAPLRWLGARSYSIYLWHWPVSVVTRPDIDLSLSGWQLFVLRTVITIGLAETSFRMIERPFRTDGFSGIAHAWGWARLSRAARGRVAPALVAGSLLVVGSLVLAFSYTQPSAPVAGVGVGSPAGAASSDGPGLSAGTGSPVGTGSPAGPGSSVGAAVGRSPQSATGAPPPRAAPGPARPVSRTTQPPPTTPPPSRARPTGQPRATARPTGPASSSRSGTVSAFGDSVMLGATAQLRAVISRIAVSAVEGRQARDVFADIAHSRAAGTLGTCVVIHTGNNGIIAPADLSRVLASLADRARVVVLTDRVPRDWQSPNNSTLHTVVARFHNAVLVDWYRISNGHRNWFYSDGLHLSPDGAAAYAKAVAAALQGGGLTHSA